MNYDFNPVEQTFIDGFIDTLATVLDGRNTDDPAARSDRGGLLAALSALAGGGFLRQGLSLAGDPAVSKAAQLATSAALAARSPSLALAAEVSVRLFGRIVDTWGTPAQKNALLKPVTDGVAVGAVALSEAAMNVENDPLETIGVPDGDTMVVNGAKSYVVNAALADWVAVAGRLEDKGAIFIISAGTDGLRVDPSSQVLGLDGVAFSSLRFENCRIAADRVIGPMDMGQMLTRIRSWENMNLCALSLGMMQAAFETARDHAKTHRSGGKPVIAYQAVGFKLSEMLTLCQTAQWLTYRAGWASESGQSDAETLVRCAKVFCSEAVAQVSAKALQVLAGAGITTANPADRGYRAAAYTQIAGLSTEIARVRIGDEAMGWK
ncbi:MAG: acyl-CoA dehydrogenase [Pseudomonadota bacterium]